VYSSGDAPVTPQIITSNTQKAIQERRVFKCLSCYSLCIAPLSFEWLRPGNNGLFYNLAIKQHGALDDKKVYTFPNYVSIQVLKEIVYFKCTVDILNLILFKHLNFAAYIYIFCSS
jgi:hypothetical protein